MRLLGMALPWWPASSPWPARLLPLSARHAAAAHTSPLIHSRCNSTANFRATAIAARFFAFFPPRSHSRSPYRRKSVSGPNWPLDILGAPYQESPQHPISGLADSQLRLAVPGILLLGH